MKKVFWKHGGRIMAFYGEDKFDAIFSAAPILTCELNAKPNGDISMKYKGKVVAIRDCEPNEKIMGGIVFVKGE